MNKDWRKPTGGTWFVDTGSVYSQLGDGTVVHVAMMDREEPNTLPTERDANCHYIVKLQNNAVRREITPENLKEARKILWELVE